LRSAVRREPALIAALALAAALRLPTLGSQSLWEDETVTRWLVGHSFGGMLSALEHTESTPPLSYVLLWPWTRLAGTGEAALRSFSALAGLATVALVYLLARELAGARAAAIAGLLAAVSPDLVWYSQEARSYALYVALSLGSVLAMLRALGRPSPGRLAVWGLLSALAWPPTTSPSSSSSPSSAGCSCACARARPWCGRRSCRCWRGARCCRWR